MAHITAIVFDLDGTLIHSAPDLQFAANAALKTVGRGPLDLPTLISFIGNGVETLVKRALKATGGGDDALERAVLAVFLEVYAKNNTTLTRPYEGVVPALEELRAKGIRLGICTNKPTAPAQDICDQLKLSPYFDVIIGAEADVPKKPDPQALMACLNRLDCLPEQAIYVGDSAIDFHTARNSGVAFRLFSEGYLNHPLPELPAEARFDNWHNHGIVVG